MKKPGWSRWNRYLPRNLSEDTPHFLNPEVLNKERDFAAEENLEAEVLLDQEDDRVNGRDDHLAAESAANSAEKMEEVLNQGMGFISGLLEMALGRKLGVAQGSEKMVTLDKKTGEVTLKFTLPGFSMDVQE